MKQSGERYGGYQLPARCVPLALRAFEADVKDRVQHFVLLDNLEFDPNQPGGVDHCNFRVVESGKTKTLVGSESAEAFIFDLDDLEIPGNEEKTIDTYVHMVSQGVVEVIFLPSAGSLHMPDSSDVTAYKGLSPDEALEKVELLANHRQADAFVVAETPSFYGVRPETKCMNFSIARPLFTPVKSAIAQQVSGQSHLLNHPIPAQCDVVLTPTPDVRLNAARNGIEKGEGNYCTIVAHPTL